MRGLAGTALCDRPLTPRLTADGHPIRQAVRNKFSSQAPPESQSSRRFWLGRGNAPSERFPAARNSAGNLPLLQPYIYARDIGMGSIVGGTQP